MSRRFASILAILTVSAVVLAGCGSSAPAAPTKAPEPTKAAAPAAAPTTAAAAPTKAPAAQPTTAPAPAAKVNFPAGKPISIVVPFAAGGSTDSATRLLAPLMEKELGAPVAVVNKPGASTQVGAAEIANAKPDGYNLLMFAIPTTLITYLDADRKSGYDRKSFQPIATAFSDGLGIAVAKDSPIKSAKDLADMAKAKPGEVKIGTAGLLGLNHLGMVAWEKQAGLKFAYVHFNSGLEAITAALGGHLDAATGTLGNVQPQFKNGSIRVLGIFDKQQSDLVPGAPTLDSQGYPVYASASYILAAPVGTPMEIVSVLNEAVKKAVTNPEYKTKVNGIGMSPLYMDTAQAANHWEQKEAETKPLLDAAK